VQIIANAKPHERQLRLAEYLRDEISDIEQQIAADRGGYDEA
jgi:hypothetical protein